MYEFVLVTFCTFVLCLLFVGWLYEICVGSCRVHKLRVYSRRVLFSEVKEYLEEEFGICLLNASDVRWRGFVEKIVKDTGKGYKRLRIAKKDT